MKKSLLLLLLLLISAEVFAFNIQLIANNKESSSQEITAQDLDRRLIPWRERLGLGLEETKNRSRIALERTMNEFTKRGSYCDLGLPELLMKHGQEAGLIGSPSNYYALIVQLRDADLIDDIFYRILRDAQDVKNAMETTLLNRMPSMPRNLYTRTLNNYDVKKIYEPFNGPWADEVKQCSITRYYKLISQLKWKHPNELHFQVHRLNWRALNEGVITLDTYNRLEVFRRYEVASWPVNVDGYLEIVTKAKDKLAKKIETKTTHSFNSTYISRKDKLTRRGRLYKTFSSTQVMVLAQLIQKTAKRMDAKYAALNFRYTDAPDSEVETYVLSPMEQYRASVKMLRKELGEIMRSESFRGTGVEFEDLVSSAFETGMIHSNELDQILQFEDMWNPKVSRFNTYKNFAFSLAGTATFYLPPPWNILGAMALILTQSRTMGKPDPDSDDNWNVII